MFNRMILLNTFMNTTKVSGTVKGQKHVCSICGEVFGNEENIQSFLNHLTYEHEVSYKEYYDKYHKRENEGLCRVCGKETKYKKSGTSHYLDFCSNECKMKNEGIEYEEHHLKGHACQLCGESDFTWVSSKGKLSMRSFLNHLRTHNIQYKDYYDTFLKKTDEGICANPDCNNETRFRGGYNEYCSVDCKNTDPKMKELVSKRFVNQPEKLDLFRERRKASGWPDDLSERIANGKMKKAKTLGLTLHEYLSEAAKKGHRNMDPIVRRQSIESAMTTRTSNGRGRHGYTFCEYDYNGTTFTVQGYEPFLLDVLRCDLGFPVQHILHPTSRNDDIEGKFIFEYFDSVNGQKRLYYPDLVIFVNDVPIVIEVKSPFTLKKYGVSFLDKGLSVIESGVSFLPIVFDVRDFLGRSERYDQDGIQEIWNSKSGNGLREGLKNRLDWSISIQAANPEEVFWYAEGSTTIPKGSSLKRGEVVGFFTENRGKEGDMVWSTLKDVAGYMSPAL